MNFAQNQFYESRILLKISFSNSVEFAKKKSPFQNFAENHFFKRWILPKISLFILICDESKENIAEQTANVKQHCTG